MLVRRVRRSSTEPTTLAAVLLLSVAGASPAAGQEITHLGASGAERLTEVVELVSPWADARDDAFLSAGSRDVQVRLLRQGPVTDSEQVHLLLFGPWGAHLYSYDALLREREGPRTLARRTERLAADIDGDGENELVLLERSLTTDLRLDEGGGELPEPGPFFASYQVAVTYLDRKDGALIEETLPADAGDARFQALLVAGLSDVLRTALQQAAGDADFAAHRFEEAAYRYRTVREWSERLLPGGDVARLTPQQPLLAADPDDPVALWIAARLRQRSLPPFFRR